MRATIRIVRFSIGIVRHLKGVDRYTILALRGNRPHLWLMKFEEKTHE